MARISVEQKALTDSRFTQLGLHITPKGLAINGYFLHALGLGAMIYVWNECQERGCHSLHAMDLEALGVQLGLLGGSFASAIVQSELGKWNRSHTEVRIRGTEGRIEWVKKLRESNAKRQKEHRQRNALVTRDNPGALALALTPALTQEKEHRIERRDPPKADASPSVMTFPVNGGSKTWSLTKKQVEEWAALYPGLDVIAECSKSLAWVRANRRKTSRGMPKFLVGWLNRANDAPQPQRKSLKIDGAYRETKPRPLIDEEYSKRYSEARAAGKTVEEAAAFASSAEDRT
jgi:hypothetical protein